jgi:hypothetical protein
MDQRAPKPKMRLGTQLRRFFGASAPDSAAERRLGAYRAPSRRGPLRWLMFALAWLLTVAYGAAFAIGAPNLLVPLTVPLAMLGGLLIWALPAGEYAPTPAIKPLFFGFFTALILWPNYIAIVLPGLPWLTLLRITALPLTAVFLISLSVSANFRRQLRETVNAAPYVWRCLLIYAGLQAISLPFSHELGSSIAQYVVALTNWVVIFFVSAYVFLRKGVLERWVLILMVMAAVIGAIGVWEYQIDALPWAGHTPSFLRIQDEAVLRILAGGARAATGIHRSQSVATTPLGLAEVLGMTAPFAMHYLLGRYPLFMRVLALAYLPFSIFVILLTDSRLGVVAYLLSVMLYLLLWASLRWRRVKGTVFAPAIVLSYPAIFIGFIASTFFIGRLQARVWGNGPQQASTEGRIEQWHAAWPKIFSHPLGYGVGQSAAALGFTNQAGVLTIDSY